jgi:hypothetical protein
LPADNEPLSIARERRVVIRTVVEEVGDVAEAVVRRPKEFVLLAPTKHGEQEGMLDVSKSQKQSNMLMVVPDDWMLATNPNSHTALEPTT